MRNLAHEGYLAGLKGLDPDPDLSKDLSSDYCKGWLNGVQDRKTGLELPKYFG